MQTQIVTIADEKSIAIDHDEVLVVVDGDGMSSEWLAQWSEDIQPSLDRQFHFLKVRFGFRGGPSGFPFVLCFWQESQMSYAIERRWLFQKAMTAIRKTIRHRKLCCYLPQPTEHVLLADDAAGVADHLHDDYWERVRILIPDGPALTQWDPYRETRLDCVGGYREWVNANPDERTSLKIADDLHGFAREWGCTFEVMSESEQIEKGLNLLHAVGQASERSPSRLIMLGHNLDQQQAPLLLVGKGVTFDTGGINLKPFESHVNCMKNDMAGAALVAHLFMALVRSGYEQPLALAIPSCENLIAQKSMKPGTILRSHSGRKVLIEHTDCEGRLILADAISYCQEQFKPHSTLVAATLTTAALRQFTGFFTPVYFAPSRLRQAWQDAAEKWGEQFVFWDRFLPFSEANRCDEADLTNMGQLPAKSRIGGGSHVAAHFLAEFASRPFMHLDIFASAWNWSGDYPGATPGATGAPFNTLFELIRRGSNV